MIFPAALSIMLSSTVLANSDNYSPAPSKFKYFVQSLYEGSKTCTGKVTSAIEIQTDTCYPRGEICKKKLPIGRENARDCELYSTPGRSHQFYKVSCTSAGIQELYYSDSKCTIAAPQISPNNGKLFALNTCQSETKCAVSNTCSDTSIGYVAPAKSSTTAAAYVTTTSTAGVYVPTTTTAPAPAPRPTTTTAQASGSQPTGGSGNNLASYSIGMTTSGSLLYLIGMWLYLF